MQRQNTRHVRLCKSLTSRDPNEEHLPSAVPGGQTGAELAAFDREL